MSKLKQFDGIRAIAIISIVICHICYGISAMSPLGQYLGGTFNFVFFLLSALLIGESVSKRTSTGMVHKKLFLKKRLIRLIPDLWIFLTLYIIVISTLGIQLNYKSVILNYGLISWFSKLPYCGHLWFVTMIFLCYLLFALLMDVKNKKKATVILMNVCCIGQIVFALIDLPAYLFLILCASGLLLLFNKQFTNLMNKANVLLCLTISAILNLTYYYFIKQGYLVIGELPYYYFGMLCGLSMLIILYRFFCIIHIGELLTFISLLSYQIYLVHHPLCNVNYLNNIIGNTFISIIIIVIASFLAAYVLKHISDYIVSKFKILNIKF